MNLSDWDGPADANIEKATFVDLNPNFPTRTPTPEPENDASQERDVVQLARYARHLEAQLGMMNGPAPEIVQAARKTPEQLAKAAEDIRKAAVEGISKQMTVRAISVLVTKIF